MKPLITRVLLTTDFSDCAGQAFQYALAIASSWKAELQVFHVLELLPAMNPVYPVNQMYLEQLHKEAVHDLNDLESRAAVAGLAIRRTIERGIPSQCIEAAAGERGVDLIVMGTHGRTGLQHVLMGSTAERVIRTAPCPVLSVKVGRDEAPSPVSVDGIRFRRLLVPIDFSASSLEALEYGLQFAKPLAASVTILHVLEPMAFGLDFSLGRSEDSRERRRHAESRLETIRSRCMSQGLKVDTVLMPGIPADSILKHAETEKPDMVIMGTHGRRGISRILSGSVADTMLRLAGCPVLTVRVPVFGADDARIIPSGEGEGMREATSA